MTRWAPAAALALTLVCCSPAAAAAPSRCGSHPWCNTSLSPDARAKLMLGAMSTSDKEGILTGQAESDVGLPAIRFTDGAVGAGGVGSGTKPATAMPAAIALAANFDPAMARRYGAAVGAEVRHRGFDGDFGPTVNIMRTPLGGRTFEAYGEDPFLSAQTAVGWIDGFQSQGVMADVKHFAANNQEGQLGVSPVFGLVGSRSHVNVHADARTLHEIELEPFEAAIRQAHSATVMCSYNMIEGRYACANPWLLTHTLRGQWGFDGFVASDAIACHETQADLDAGLNFDIVGSCYEPEMVDPLLRLGLVSERTLDQRVYEILRTLFAFGFFDHPTWPNDPSQDDQAADNAVADDAEAGGEVLLRNDGTLPVDPRRVRSIAVIGPAASQYIFGAGSSQVTPYREVTALQGIQARAAADHIPVTYDDGSNAASAARTAAAADLAVVVAADSESEGDDKPCMSLNPTCSGGEATPPSPLAHQTVFGDQDALIERVAAANRHTVVVLETGAPVLTPWRNSIAALLEAWYPGQDGGTPIARVLFGDTDPGGRLPATFPKAAGDIPTATGGPSRYPGVIDPAAGSCTFNETSGPCPLYQEQYSEGVMVGYRWYDSQRIAPAFPFGYGLSYTTFSYTRPAIALEPVGAIDVAVTVRNSGARTGWAVPQAYVSLPSSPGVPEPPWQLRGFAKVLLAPGRSARVHMQLDRRAFSYWSDAADGWRSAPGCARIAVGSSSRRLRDAGGVDPLGAGTRCR